MIVSIIAFIILLLFLVTIHEFGHFILARKAGVKIHEFAVGMGPKIWSFGEDSKGTEFTIRLLPIGGFVRIKGESPAEEGAFDAPDSFINATYWWKAIILLGGIIMNLIGAWIIFTIGFTVGIKPIQILPQNAIKWESHSYLLPTEKFLQAEWFLSGEVKPAVALVNELASDLLWAKAGLQKNDTILSVDGKAVDANTLPAVLQTYIGKSFLMVVDRKGSQESIAITCPEDSCILWVSFGERVWYELLPIKFPFFKAMGVALWEMKEQTRLTLNGLWNIFRQLGTSKRWETVHKLSGPIGAARVWQFVLASGGWIMFLVFGWLLSLGLAIFNLLPIPALDWGRLLGVTIQKVFRLKADTYYKIEWWINTVFFVALLLLWFYIMAQDLVRAWGVRIPGIG
jgi:regulator of sigma E protease